MEKIMITVFLAIFGGLARLLSQKEKAAMVNILSNCIVSAFSGMLAYFASVYFRLDQSVTFIIAGISGWMGPQAIELFVKTFLDKSGLNAQKDTGAESIARRTADHHAADIPPPAGEGPESEAPSDME